MRHSFIRYNTAKQIAEKLSATTLIAFLLLTGSVLLSHKAMAFNTGAPEIGNSAPQGASADIIGGPNNPVQPWMSVGVGAYNGPNGYAKIYVPVGTGATLTIHNGGGYCMTNGVANSLDVKSAGYGNPNVDYSIWNLSDQELWTTGTPPPSGYNNPSTAAGTKVNSLSGGTGCHDVTLKFPGGIASVHPGHEYYKVYYFSADMQNNVNIPGVSDTEKNFRLNINNGGLIGWSRKMIDHPVNQFGIYMRDAPYRGGTNWDYAVQFAPYCDEQNIGPTASVVVKDVDWNVPGFSQPNLTGLVDKDKRTDSSYSWGLAPPGQPSSKKVTNDWPSGNGTTAKLTFDISNTNNRYLLVFRDINFRNTIQIQLPYDQFDAQQSVGTECNTTISCNATASPGSVAAAGNLSTITIVGNGNIKWTAPAGNGYYIKRINATDSPNEANNAATTYKVGSTYKDGVNPNPPSGSSVTYMYSVYDPSNNKVPGATCPATVTIGAPPGATATPYFQVWQNDAAAGGAFMNGSACTNSSYPAYVSPGSANAFGKSTPEYYGDIRGNEATRSITDFGAVALGLIPNSGGEGFSSANNTIFANNLAGTSFNGMGSGYFNHSPTPSTTSQYHCATDFYGTTMINIPTSASGDLNAVITVCKAKITNPGRCQYQWSGDITGGLVSIPQGVQITLYVTSNIKIDTNIQYQSFDPSTRANIPYFALIDQGGNITLTNNATRLDGLYVAQPKPIAGNIVPGTGVFATCPTASQCPNQLIVNGAVIAQHVKLLRAHGDSAGNVAVGNTPAEIFNFVPSMVLGAPNFSPQPPAPVSQFSLPPVF